MLTTLRGSFIDDLINVGNSELENLSELTLHCFAAKPGFYDSFNFHDAQIETSKQCELKEPRRYYAENMQFIL